MPPERFLERTGVQVPNQISPDGKHLLFVDGAPDAPGEFDVWFVALDNGEPEPFLAQSNRQDQATFSPNGKWVAFRSNASGRNEIYCTPFPGPGAVIQISNDRGNSPVWAKDGSRIYYVVSPGDLLEAKVVPGSDLEFEAPRQIQRGVIPRSTRRASFDSARDGRLIMSNVNVGARNTTERPSVVVVLNWFEVVEQLAPRR
jgi:acylaminoacyl-peptidase